MEQNPRMTSLIRLKEIGQDHKEFAIQEKARSLLANLKDRCYFIAVSGSAGLGKSTLLNLLIKEFTSCYKEIMPIGEDLRAKTKGIDIFVTKYEGNNIVFLDLEGCVDIEQGDDISWIATILMLIAANCGINFFNFMGNKPEGTLLNHLKLFSKFAFHFIQRDAKTTTVEAKKRLFTYLHQYFPLTTMDNIVLIPYLSDQFREELKKEQRIMQNPDIDSQKVLEGIKSLSNFIKDKIDNIRYFPSGEHALNELNSLLKQVPYFKKENFELSFARLQRLTEFSAQKIQINQELLKIERQNQKELLDGLLAAIPDSKSYDKSMIKNVELEIKRTITPSTMIAQALFLCLSLKNFYKQIQNKTLGEVEQRVIDETFIVPLRKIILSDLTELEKNIKNAKKVVSGNVIKEITENRKTTQKWLLSSLAGSSVGLSGCGTALECLATAETASFFGLSQIATTALSNGLIFTGIASGGAVLAIGGLIYAFAKQKKEPTALLIKLKNLIKIIVQRKGNITQSFLQVENEYHRIMSLKKKNKEIDYIFLSPLVSLCQELQDIQTEVNEESNREQLTIQSS